MHLSGQVSNHVLIMLLCEFATVRDALHRECCSARQDLSAAVGGLLWLVMVLFTRGWTIKFYRVFVAAVVRATPKTHARRGRVLP